MIQIYSYDHNSYIYMQKYRNVYDQWFAEIENEYPLPLVKQFIVSFNDLLESIVKNLDRPHKEPENLNTMSDGDYVNVFVEWQKRRQQKVFLSSNSKVFTNFDQYP